MKSIFKSKTIWASILYAGLMGFSPLIQKFTDEHSGVAGCSVAGIFILLRMITKGGVYVKKQ